MYSYQELNLNIDLEFANEFFSTPDNLRVETTLTPQVAKGTLQPENHCRKQAGSVIVERIMWDVRRVTLHVLWGHK